MIFDDGTAKQATWQSSAPVVDTLALAKDCATRIVDALLRDKREDLIRNTNWASAVAAMQRHVADWNARLRDSRPVDNLH